MVGQAEGVAVQPGELHHRLLELERLAEHEPHVGRSIDHRAEGAGRVAGIDALVDQALLLPAADRRRVALHEVAPVGPPDRGRPRVERGHRLDDAHHPGVLLEAAEVAAVGPLDALGQRGAGRQVRLVLGGEQQQVLELVGDLAEDLLLRAEVRVEGAVGDAGPLGDVADVGVEVALALEEGARRLHERGARAGAARGQRRRTRWRGRRRVRVGRRIDVGVGVHSIPPLFWSGSRSPPRPGSGRRRTDRLTPSRSARRAARGGGSCRSPSSAARRRTRSSAGTCRPPSAPCRTR